MLDGHAAREREGQHVLAEHHRGREHRIRPHARELMYADTAAQRAVVPHLDMASQAHVVREYHAVAQAAVVRDVRVRHEEAVRSDPRRRFHARCTVHRYAFSQDVVVADLDPRVLSLEGEVLRQIAEHRMRMHAIARAEPHVAVDHRMGSHGRAVTDLDGVLDDRVRTDRHAGAERGAARDEGGRVNGRLGHTGLGGSDSRGPKNNCERRPDVSRRREADDQSGGTGGFSLWGWEASDRCARRASYRARDRTRTCTAPSSRRGCRADRCAPHWPRAASGAEPGPQGASAVVSVCPQCLRFLPNLP